MVNVLRLLISTWPNKALDNLPPIHTHIHTPMGWSYHAMRWPAHREQLGVQWRSRTLWHADRRSRGSNNLCISFLKLQQWAAEQLVISASERMSLTESIPCFGVLMRLCTWRWLDGQWMLSYFWLVGGLSWMNPITKSLTLILHKTSMCPVYRDIKPCLCTDVCMAQRASKLAEPLLD